MPTEISQIKNRFRSSATWKPSDWQDQCDQLLDRINRSGWLYADKPCDAPGQEPIILADDEYAVLARGAEALTAARIANDMPKFRRIIQQYEERALEFFARGRARRLEEISTRQV